MNGKAVSRTMLALLLASIPTLALNIEPVESKLMSGSGVVGDSDPFSFAGISILMYSWCNLGSGWIYDSMFALTGETDISNVDAADYTFAYYWAINVPLDSILLVEQGGFYGAIQPIAFEASAPWGSGGLGHMVYNWWYLDDGSTDFSIVSRLVASVDIHPDTLNMKSKGKWISAHIELPEGYDVSDIDILTIMMNDTVSACPDAPTEIDDFDKDGIQDLMVKFDRHEVMALLSVNEATLTITGRVDDTPFEGSDIIRTTGR